MSLVSRAFFVTSWSAWLRISAASVWACNFRLIDRLFTEIECIMKINELNTIPITDVVVEVARSTLVVGLQ